MAELDNFISSLEKELTCSICAEIFNQPKQLPCLHSLCGSCIEDYDKSCRERRQRLACPLCRSPFDVSSIRTAFHLVPMIELICVMRSQTSELCDNELPNCVSCEKHVKLVAFCQQCEGMICTDCVNTHSRIKQLRDQHKITILTDFKKKDLNGYVSNRAQCQEKYHEKEKLEYFCETCQKCVCQKCSITTHGTHKKMSMEEKADEKKGLITKSLYEVEKLTKKFKQELELSKQNIERIEYEVVMAKNEVSAHMLEIIKLLKNHETKMTNVLDDVFTEQKKENDKEQKEIDTIIKQLKATTEQGATLLDQNVDYLILQSPFLQKCDEMLEKPSVLPSKANKRNISLRLTPNTQVIQSLHGQDLDKLVAITPDPSRCSLEIKCGAVNQFHFVTRDSEGEVCYTNKGSIHVEIKDNDGCKVESELVEEETGKFIVTFKENEPSSYQITVSIAGQPINNSPVKVRAPNDEMAETNFGKKDFECQSSEHYRRKPILPDTVHPDLCSWGHFNEKGGKLTIKRTGVSLYIPQKALPEGTNQMIYIGLMSSKGLYPKTEDCQTFVSPAVICGPERLRFERPVYLNLPHNAVIDNTWKPQVYACAAVPKNQNDCGQWKIIEDPEDKEPPIVHVDSKSMQIMIDHFTAFILVGRSPAKKMSWIVPFYTKPSVDVYFSVRIYSIPATDAALEELKIKEENLRGKMADAYKMLIIRNNDSNVVVAVKNTREGWSADELEQNIPFEHIWQYHHNFPNVSFTFERESEDRCLFSSNFTAQQDMDNGDIVTVKVVSSTENQQQPLSEFSARASSLAENRCNTEMFSQIPHTTKTELCLLLDIERIDGMDWRGLAERLGWRKRCIDWLQGSKRVTSPTEEIISWWECTKSREIPLPMLVGILEDMERHDAVEELSRIEDAGI